MATLYATDGTIALNMFTTSVEHDAQQSATSSQYVWSTASGQIIRAYSFADDITANATSPLGGTVHALQVDDSYLVGGLNASLLSLTTAPNQENYWRAILAGETTIYASTTATFLGSGDFITVAAGESLTGGNDIFETAATDQSFIGDANIVDEDAVLKGGDDDITVRHRSVADGDTADVNGFLTGGNDRFVVDGAESDIVVVGDSENCGHAVPASAPVIIGGNDTIIILQAATGGFIGDVLRTFAALGSITGGNDTIDASASDGAHELVGDVFNLRTGTLKGGRDTLIASATNSFGSRLVGDVSALDGGTLLAGADKLIGGSGGDTLYGDYFENAGAVVTTNGRFTGNDSIYGGTNSDGLYGQVGNDTLDGGAGNDILDGGAQNGGSGDFAAFNSLKVAVSVDLLAGFAFGQGNDTLSGIESIRGSAKGDSLAGNAAVNRLEGLDGADNLFGRGGNDTLLGASGNDSISGGGGNDTIVGGLGADTMAAGAGLDVFRYGAANESGLSPAARDYIQGFVQAGGSRDVIDLHAIDAQAGTLGNQDFDFIASAAFTAEGQVRFQAIAGGDTLIEINTVGNSSAEMRIVIDGLFTLTANDFEL